MLSNVRTNDNLEIPPEFDCYNLVLEKTNNAFMRYSKQLMESIPKEVLRYPMPLSVNSACRLEKFGLLRYRAGQHYDWHIDADHDPFKESHMRSFSGAIYLNDDFEETG